MNDLSSSQISDSPPSVRLSRFPFRLVAFLIDSLIGSILAGIIFTFLILPIAVPDHMERMDQFYSLLEQVSDSQTDNQRIAEEIQDVLGPVMITASISMLVLMTLFYTLSEILTKGSSIGKQLFRYRVYNLQTREPITPLASLFRSFIKAFCLMFHLPGYLGTLVFVGIVLLPLFTSRRQGLHDILVKSIVMDEKTLWVRVDQIPPHQETN